MSTSYVGQVTSSLSTRYLLIRHGPLVEFWSVKVIEQPHREEHIDGHLYVEKKGIF